MTKRKAKRAKKRLAKKWNKGMIVLEFKVGGRVRIPTFTGYEKKFGEIIAITPNSIDVQYSDNAVTKFSLKHLKDTFGVHHIVPKPTKIVKIDPDTGEVTEGTKDELLPMSDQTLAEVNECVKNIQASMAASRRPACEAAAPPCDAPEPGTSTREDDYDHSPINPPF